MQNRTLYLGITLFIIVCISFSTAPPVNAFVQGYSISSGGPPGFFFAIWHGLLAPYSLVARWFIDDVQMYATPNTGWFYDFGFLIGMIGSLPIGWIAAIFSVLLHIIIL